MEKTMIDEMMLERICRNAPQHADFWQGFFKTCEREDLKSNLTNYICDVRREQLIRPDVDMQLMLAAFYLVAYDPEKGPVYSYAS